MFDRPPTFPALRTELFDAPTQDRLTGKAHSIHPPRFLMLYGSVRDRSYSRLVTFEAASLLEAMGGEVKVFDPTGLPLPDGAPETHPKVQELCQLAAWSEGMVWCSPERHGAMTGIMKAVIEAGEPEKHLNKPVWKYCSAQPRNPYRRNARGTRHGTGERSISDCAVTVMRHCTHRCATTCPASWAPLWPSFLQARPRP